MNPNLSDLFPNLTKKFSCLNQTVTIWQRSGTPVVRVWVCAESIAKYLFIYIMLGKLNRSSGKVPLNAQRNLHFHGFFSLIVVLYSTLCSGNLLLNYILSSHFTHCVLLQCKQVILNMHDPVISSQTKEQSNVQQENFLTICQSVTGVATTTLPPKSRMRYCLCTYWTESGFWGCFTNLNALKSSMKSSQIHFLW